MGFRRRWYGGSAVGRGGDLLSGTLGLSYLLLDPPRCHHTSDDGSPCNAPPQSGKKYCFFHDPRQQKKREAAHRNGGFMRNRRSQTEDHAPLLPPNPPLVSFKTFDDVGQFFEQVTNYVLQGQMDARTANCLRQLASGRLRV